MSADAERNIDAIGEQENPNAERIERETSCCADPECGHRKKDGMLPFVRRAEVGTRDERVLGVLLITFQGDETNAIELDGEEEENDHQRPEVPDGKLVK